MSDRVVLVVDDEPVVLFVVSSCLEMTTGWTVMTAPGGAEALELLRTYPVDAVVTDYMMPGMNGLELFCRLRADPATQDVPVVLLTAKALVGDAQVWDGIGVDGVIAKPFDSKTLASKIADFAGWGANTPPAWPSVEAQAVWARR